MQGGAERGSGIGLFLEGRPCLRGHLPDRRHGQPRSATRPTRIGTSKHWCDNANVDAFGIAVESFGTGAADKRFSMSSIEGDTVDHTRTGQSETLSVNGDVEDFLVAHNLVYDTDNIGIDAIGWESGSDQARHGYIGDNTVANVDTWGNHAYGQMDPARVCRPMPENAAGIYDDGASYIWIDNNVV